jgi:hypothetical protein
VRGTKQSPSQIAPAFGLAKQLFRDKKNTLFDAPINKMGNAKLFIVIYIVYFGESFYWQINE